MVQRRRQLYRYAVDVFVELVRQVTGRRSVEYRCDENDVSAWNNFINTFGNGIGEEFIRKFCEFGINTWFGESSRGKDHSYKIRFTWVFGSNAIKRWNRCTSSANEHFTRKGIKRKGGIDLNDKMGEKAALINSVRVVEERFKGMYHNTKRGFSWCVANTTLYFHKSSFCVKCDFKNDCREILKNEFPKIYELRGYGKE